MASGDYDDNNTEYLLSHSSDDLINPLGGAGGQKSKGIYKHETRMYRSLLGTALFLLFGLFVFIAVVALLMILIFIKPAQDTVVRTNYVLVGDWGREGLFYQKDVAHQMALYCEPIISGSKSNCKNVISLGDNIYENGVSSPDAPEFRTSFSDIYEKYDSLLIPWKIMFGNHDYRLSLQAQIDYSNRPNTLWETGGNGLYYSFDNDIPYTPLRTIIIDTVPMLQKYWDDEYTNKTALVDPTEQLAWFENELARAKNDSVMPIVFGHHPVYCVSDKEVEELQDMQKAIEEILIKYRVSVYIAGHEHNMQHIPIHYDKFDKPILDPTLVGNSVHTINYVVTGGGSKMRPLPSTNIYRRNLKYGYDKGAFVGMSVTTRKIDFTFISFEGENLYSFSIPVKRDN